MNDCGVGFGFTEWINFLLCTCGEWGERVLETPWNATWATISLCPLIQGASLPLLPHSLRMEFRETSGWWEMDSWVSGSFIDIAGVGTLVKLNHTDDVPLSDTL